MTNIEVVTSACIGTKDAACVTVCPVNCFYDAGTMLVVNPDECIGCTACVSVCPVNAIFPIEDVPESEAQYIAINRDFFSGKTPEEVERLRMEP